MRTFLDIGAHLGETLSIVRAKRWHFDRIVCFEPAAVCWPSIEALADERVTICHFGLWKEPATIALHNPGSVGASIAPDAKVVTQTIDCRFEDAAAWFAEHLSDKETVFVKINVEGAEADIVDRLAAADQLRRIDHLLIHFDVRKSPTLAHREAALRAQLDAAGIEWINADVIEFGGVYRGTRNWLLWCEADARFRDLRYRYFKRVEHRVRRRLYPLKQAMMIRSSRANKTES
jgi:FkbM family methyltransferase